MLDTPPQGLYGRRLPAESHVFPVALAKNALRTAAQRGFLAVWTHCGLHRKTSDPLQNRCVTSIDSVRQPLQNKPYQVCVVSCFSLQ